jgi:hypothetical protein
MRSPVRPSFSSSENRTSDRLTAIEDIVDAGKQLYATLTPGQRAVADRRMAAPVTALAGVEPNTAAARAGVDGKNP